MLIEHPEDRRTHARARAGTPSGDRSFLVSHCPAACPGSPIARPGLSPSLPLQHLEAVPPAQSNRTENKDEGSRGLHVRQVRPHSRSMGVRGWLRPTVQEPQGTEHRDAESHEHTEPHSLPRAHIPPCLSARVRHTPRIAAGRSVAPPVAPIPENASLRLRGARGVNSRQASGRMAATGARLCR
jgi:hypothetical protein